MLVFKQACLVAIALAISGCTGTKSLSSEFIGTCLKTETDAFIHISNCRAGTGDYLISTRKAGGRCIKKAPQSVLTAGSELKIVRVMKQGRGSTGDCLRIEARILSGEQAGWLVDLPVCGILHPSPWWITHGFDAESRIVFNQEYVALVACSEDK